MPFHKSIPRGAGGDASGRGGLLRRAESARGAEFARRADFPRPADFPPGGPDRNGHIGVANGRWHQGNAEEGGVLRGRVRARWAFPWLALLLGSWVAAGRAEINVGDAFPELATSGVVALGSSALPATAGQVVLVDFWASWCAPCKASFPAMAELHQAFAARGLVIAAINVDREPAKALAFAKKLAPPFSLLHDPLQTFANQVVVPAMPTSYLLGRDGRVRFRHKGFDGSTTPRQLRQEIETLLAEKSGPLSP